MVLNFLTKVFGSKNERELKQMQPLVERINELEPEVQALNDEQLKAQTAAFKQRLDQGDPPSGEGWKFSAIQPLKNST